MTRKDFVLIAQMLGENMARMDFSPDDGCVILFFQRCAAKLATTNPNFKRDTFVGACQNAMIDVPSDERG